MRRFALPVLLLAGAAPAQPQNAAPTPAQATALALRWMLSAQNRDGSWGLDARTEGDVGCTVIASLALMADGNTERGGPDPRCVQAVRKALDYILRHARTMKGDIWRGETTLIQSKLGQRIHTFMATVFLTQVYGMRSAYVRPEDVEELRDHISSLTRVIVTSQEADGSWHKETFGSLKATCMAWLALRSAAATGHDVENASVARTLKFIKAQYSPQTRLFDRGATNGGYQSIYSTASCLRVLYAMGEGDSPEAAGATEAFMKFVSTGPMGQAYLTVEGEDYLSAALFTHALLTVDRDKRWNEWFPWITKELLRRQARDGTWTTTACITGRTFATSGALLTLQAPLRLLPLLEQ